MMKLVFSALAVAIVLSGCVSAGTAPSSGSSPVVAESATPTVPRVENLASVIGKAWTGTDSDGDLNIIAFGDDGSVTTTQMGEVTTGRDDGWTIADDILTFTIDYGSDGGVATYTATFDPETQVLAADFETTTGRTGSIDLVRTSY